MIEIKVGHFYKDSRSIYLPLDITKDYTFTSEIVKFVGHEADDISKWVNLPIKGTVEVYWNPKTKEFQDEEI